MDEFGKVISLFKLHLVENKMGNSYKKRMFTF